MKNYLLALLLVASALPAAAQNVNIPDANFKAYLVGNTNINTTNDGEITVAEATAYTGVMSCNLKGNITDLTGIEAFTEITILNCGTLTSTRLSSLDVSMNTKLTHLECKGHFSPTLDVTKNTKLESLHCSGNKLTSLDVSKNVLLKKLSVLTNLITSLDLSNNIDLTELYCNSNQIASLNISKCTKLTKLETQINKLRSLDVSVHPKLFTLHCASNTISSLDVSNCPLLYSLQIQNLQFTAIDLSKNIVLEKFACGGNKIKKIDVSKNPRLTELNCYNNALTQLNAANGNNKKIIDFKAHQNPDLKCIQVDSTVWSTTNWTRIDPGAGFNEDCKYVNTSSVKEHSIANGKVYPNPASDYLTIALDVPFKEVTIYSINGVKVLQEQKSTFSVAHLNRGLYIARIATENGIITKRFAKR